MFISLLPLCHINLRTPFSDMITCSDASEEGGGVCYSKDLSPWGLNALYVLDECGVGDSSSKNTAPVELLLISLFDGIGSMKVALDVLGAKVSGFIAVELDPDASKVVNTHHPGVLHVDDVGSISKDMVIQWSLQFQTVTHILLSAGAPCVGVSGLNSTRLGVEKDSRSSLHFHVPRIRELLTQVFSWATIHLFEENVASMDKADEKLYSSSLNLLPVQLCPGTFSWVRRPRLYWFTWPIIEDVSVELHPRWHGSKLEVHGNRMAAERWISGDAKLMQPDTIFPTFTRSIVRKAPPPCPAGLSSTPPDAQSRWIADEFRFPPYTYKREFCLIDSLGVIRKLCAQEREIISGFPKAYTEPCWPKSKRKSQPRRWEDCRLSLIGNAFNIYAVCVLLLPLVNSLFSSSWSVSSVIDVLNGISLPKSINQVASREFNQNFTRCFVADASLRLIKGICRGVSYKGDDVRLLSADSSSAPWPRQAIPSGWWNWKVAMSYRFKHSLGPEHINALEMRALLSTIKWRASQINTANCRCLHLSDSQVCIGIVTKGRTSSCRIKHIIQQINALMLASNLHLLCAYVATHDNPADEPSRSCVRRSRRKPKWVRRNKF